MALAKSWDLSQSKDDENWLGETPGSKTQITLLVALLFVTLLLVALLLVTLLIFF
jgi:hypothetical protein